MQYQISGHFQVTEYFLKRFFYYCRNSFFFSLKVGRSFRLCRAAQMKKWLAQHPHDHGPLYAIYFWVCHIPIDWFLHFYILNYLSIVNAPQLWLHKLWFAWIRCSTIGTEHYFYCSCILHIRVIVYIILTMVNAIDWDHTQDYDYNIRHFHDASVGVSKSFLVHLEQRKRHH